MRAKVVTMMRWYAQDEVNQEDSEQNEVDGMKKGADSTGKVMHMWESGWWLDSWVGWGQTQGRGSVKVNSDTGSYTSLMGVTRECYEFFGCNDQWSSSTLLLLRFSSLSNSDEQKNSANMCVIFTVQADNDEMLKICTEKASNYHQICLYLSLTNINAYTIKYSTTTQSNKQPTI